MTQPEDRRTRGSGNRSGGDPWRPADPSEWVSPRWEPLVQPVPPQPEQPARQPSRARTEFVGAVVITTLVVAGVGALAAALHDLGNPREVASRAVRGPATAGDPTAAPGEPGEAPIAEITTTRAPTAAGVVDVYNASGVQGAAAKVSETLRAAGWTVSEVGTLPGDARQSVVQYPAGPDLEEATRAAAALGLSNTIQKPGIPRVRVVVGTDLALAGGATRRPTATATVTPTVPSPTLSKRPASPTKTARPTTTASTSVTKPPTTTP